MAIHPIGKVQGEEMKMADAYLIACADLAEVSKTV